MKTDHKGNPENDTESTVHRETKIVREQLTDNTADPNTCSRHFQTYSRSVVNTNNRFWDTLWHVSNML